MNDNSKQPAPASGEVKVRALDSLTVAELIAQLQKLPGDLLVVKNWEGELHGVRTARVLTAHRYLGGTTLWEDYYPEFTAENEDYEQFTLVIVE